MKNNICKIFILMIAFFPFTTSCFFFSSISEEQKLIDCLKKISEFEKDPVINFDGSEEEYLEMLETELVFYKWSMVEALGRLELIKLDCQKMLIFTKEELAEKEEIVQKLYNELDLKKKNLLSKVDKFINIVKPNNEYHRTLFEYKQMAFKLDMAMTLWELLGVFVHLAANGDTVHYHDSSLNRRLLERVPNLKYSGRNSWV